MGTPEQKERFLPLLARGDRIGAFALTEANTGSDVAAIVATATRGGSDYVINASKQFITNGGIASLVVVFAKTDRSHGHRGISTFVVVKEVSPFIVAKDENKMGWASPEKVDMKIRYNCVHLNRRNYETETQKVQS